jgi:RNA polymerase sigma factor (sigma-70 family)
MATGKTSEVIQHFRRAVLLREGAGMTDGQLLECFLTQRDDAAFAALVRRHGPMVWGVCRRVVHNHHDAEDAFQATFLVLVRRAASVEPKELVANWLYGVAYQTALKARSVAARRRGRERQVVEVPEPAVEEQDVWHDLRPLLDQELSRLPDKYRVPVVLCDLEGKTRKEAAQQLGWPEGTVAGRLATARRMLARRLARRGVALSGGMLAAVLSHNAASACVPPSVVSSTIKAASLLAAGQAATGAISLKVAALTEGVLKTMPFAKLKVVMVLVVVAALSGAAGLICPTPATGGANAQVRPAAPPTKPQSVETARKQTPVKLRLDGTPVSVAWSPDGKTVATIGHVKAKDDKELPGSVVQLWDAKTGKEKLSLGVEENTTLKSLTFSPDGKSLAMSHFRYQRGENRHVCKVKAWDTEKGELRLSLDESHEKGGSGWVSFSPDGKLLASVGCRVEPLKGEFERYVAEVKLWDVRTGKMVRKLDVVRERDFCNSFGPIVFSPDGRTIAAGGCRLEYTKEMLPDNADLDKPIGMNPGVHNEVYLFETQTGKVRAVLTGHSDHITSVVFSAAGLLATASQDGVVHVWDAKTAKEKRKWAAYESHAAVDLAFHPDGKTLASVGAKSVGEVKLWDAPAGELKQTVGCDDRRVLDIAFSPEGRYLAIGSGNTVELRRLDK